MKKFINILAAVAVVALVVGCLAVEGKARSDLKTPEKAEFGRIRRGHGLSLIHI